MTRFAFVALLVGFGLAHPQASDPAAPQTGAATSPHALVGVHVVGIGGAPAIDDATILIRDGKIEAVGPSAKVQVPRGARTTNLSGKFVLPGLISAHAHVSDVDGLRPRAYTAANTVRQLGVFARYGVTTVGSLGGEQAPAFQARDEQSTPALSRA